MPPESASDHDLLIRIDEKLTLLFGSFSSHEKENKEEFDLVHRRISNLENNRVSPLEKIVWTGLGGVIVLQFILFAILKYCH